MESLRVYDAPEPECFLECCEWCGRDTNLYGRFRLTSGPGLYIVLCGVCADRNTPAPWYLKDQQYQEVIPDPR